jgi:hypothetical protein
VEEQAPPSPLAPREVVLSIDTKPSGAIVAVNAQERGRSPIDVRVPYGAAPISIELRRPGFAKVVQWVTPDADRRIVLELQPEPARSRPTRVAQPASSPTGSPKTFWKF